ncbi:hypothetical protein RS130_20975 [Paraglaciecola aquimarina]|uniref:Uncharacterized protein n=1 Tax=Paraglaciecola aquimarina TaxID=1235557 RepID=A0ABU3T184_9ALTE|nr:hypothetical protein [Paraglaciecola aquimarina]MDU0356031.1 hypothetical protein [Paraglaciecola aquimarina]
MSLLSSAPIVIPSKKPNFQGVIASSIGRSPVLELLLPQLCADQQRPAKARQQLKNIDSYMLAETLLLLNKVETLCHQFSLSNGQNFKIALKQNSLSVSGNFADSEKLLKLIDQDSWFCGSLAWLCPNYLGLAHSQELVGFSHVYANNKQQASHQFSHFQQANQGLTCYLDGQVLEGQLTVNWYVESPVVRYYLRG